MTEEKIFAQALFSCSFYPLKSRHYFLSVLHAVFSLGMQRKELYLHKHGSTRMHESNTRFMEHQHVSII